MEKFDHQKIEAKWHKKWKKEKIYRTGEDKSKSKYYVLDMFPYPSGAGLHVGHPKGYIATDILARLKMMQGFNVLHPMGWDAFGLPAENYALKNKVHPRVATEKNIATFKGQLEKIGLTYDWEREINTTDPEYYKWTQWAFIKMWEKGLAYESFEPIIWCPKCQTGLAMEDLEDGKCERCESEVERKPMRQWVIKITDYAERLLNDLDKLSGWEDSIKEMQRNWIGRSEGAEVRFQIKDKREEIKNSPLERGAEPGEAGCVTVFTTRPDTLFGVTYVVLAPENPLITNYKLQITNWSEVEKYINEAKKKSDLQRTDLNKDKTGVKLEGIMAVNPANGEEVPVFIADYVLASYGTGAVMAVPAHDQRDFEFATKYNEERREKREEMLKIKCVVSPTDSETRELYRLVGVTPNEDPQKIIEEIFSGERCYSWIGVNINSGFLNGLPTVEAKKKMIEWLEKEGKGKKKVNYKLNDWVFSRQRYWGEPIPMVHCEKCGTVPVAEKDLPVRLPDVEHYEPSGTGESPLANITDWVNTTCPKCGGSAKRETNTMPQWAGSSWYYLRYIDPKNNSALVDKAKEKYWSPVDFYVGGAEHATRHLIYARFWHKFLFDIGVVNYDEPFTRLQHVGLIMAEDGRKMSKRWGNVINPDDIIEKFGADAMRVYEMFMGPFGAACAWNTNGLTGARKFLDRVWAIAENIEQRAENKDINGVGALIQLENGNFIFQERDENIERNPGMITPFGGGIKEGESFEDALKRELKEEIDLDFDNAKIIFDFDFESHFEKGKFIKLFYIKISNKDSLKLKEGKSIVELKLDEAKKNEKVTKFTKGVLEKCEKVWTEYHYEKEFKSILHKTIKKVSEDIIEFKFNTCVSSLMILSNALVWMNFSKDYFAKFIQILAPFAPHLAEEIWREKLGNKESIFKSAWPSFDPELIKDETINLIVQVNGKLRATIEVAADISQADAENLARENDNVKKWLEGKEVAKIVFIPGKLLNIVIK
jgi:leucyl-tRNA synthetase